MRDFLIPEILYTGYLSRRNHRFYIAAAIIALLLHILFIVGAWQLDLLPTFLIAPSKPPERVDAMQFVLVDQNLTDEKPDELDQNKLRGRVSRVSRAEEINPNLPKNGPSAEEKSAYTDFKAGKPVPPSPASAPVAPSKPQPVSKAAPATPPVPQMKPLPEVKPVQKTPTPVEAQKPPVEKPSEKPAEKPEPVAKTADLAPDLTEDVEKLAFLPVPAKKKAEGEKGTAAEKPEAKPDDPEKALKSAEKAEKTEKIEKVEKQEKTEPEQQTQPPVTAQPQQTPTPPTPPLPESTPTRNIPIKRIGSKPRTQGGSLGRRENSSAAMKAGFKSMAVLRDRYGDYLDLILRRIQEAILIQQQLSPVMFNQGSVVMTFSIDADGRLGEIRFIASEPEALPNESSAARRVLQDVASGAPFPPPTPQMLADPNFQKIVINFIFEPR